VGITAKEGTGGRVVAAKVYQIQPTLELAFCNRHMIALDHDLEDYEKDMNN
jgi:hypothetical protein